MCNAFHKQSKFQSEESVTPDGGERYREEKVRKAGQDREKCIALRKPISLTPETVPADDHKFVSDFRDEGTFARQVGGVRDISDELGVG